MNRILIADDHPVVRAGLRAVFSTHNGFTVVGEVDRAAQALVAARNLSPDVVTMDLRFPDGISGVEAITALQAMPTAPAVLVLTNYDDDSDILAAVEAGASGYLLKDSAPEDLCRAVADTAAGRSVLPAHIATKLMARMRAPAVELTAREADVLGAIDRGLSNRDIAAELYLGHTTVKTHLARLYGKLGVSSRTAALAKARKLGLLKG